MAPHGLVRFNVALFRTVELCGRRCFTVGATNRQVSKEEKTSQYAEGETHFGFETVKEEEKSSKGRLCLLFTRRLINKL